MRRAVSSSGVAKGRDATNRCAAQTAEQLRQSTELEVEIGGAIEIWSDPSLLPAASGLAHGGSSRM